MRAAIPERISIFEGVDPNIGGQIASMRRDIEFMLAGGAQLALELKAIEVNAEDIGLERTLELLEDAQLEAIAISVEMGEMTLNEGVREAVGELGVDATIAREAIEGFGRGLDILDGKQIRTSVINTITNIVTGQTTGAGAAAAIDAGAAGPTGPAGTPTQSGNADVVAAINNLAPQIAEQVDALGAQ
jgi:hypothetical protein